MSYVVEREFTHREVLEADGLPEAAILEWLTTNTSEGWSSSHPNWSVSDEDGKTRYRYLGQPKLTFAFEHQEDAALFRMFWC